ncbi:MAG: hypothetical protein WAZ31_09275 [Rectinemataceae bacterium]
MKKLLMKIDRVAAWTLVAVVATYFITGYGMTKAIIPAELSKFIHDSLLPLPSAAAFGLHSAYGIHIALKRWKVWGKPWSIALTVYAILFVLGVAYMQFFVKNAGAAALGPVEINL